MPILKLQKTFFSLTEVKYFQWSFVNMEIEYRAQTKKYISKCNNQRYKIYF